MKSAKRSGREAIDIETLKWSGLGYLSSFSGRCWEGREMFVGSWFQYSLKLGVGFINPHGAMQIPKRLRC